MRRQISRRGFETAEYTQIDTRALLAVKIRVRMRNSDEKKKFLTELCDLRAAR